MLLLERLQKQGVISPPKEIQDGRVQYLCMMGSVAYGVSDVESDVDLYGWCIPPKQVVFPHLRGEILGFGKQKQRFDQYQQHHIKDPSNNKEYDICVYNIIKYFQLVMENNPNMIDSLYVPQRCILHSTQCSELVRSQRDIFLHKGCWPKFRGYSFSQLHKIDIKDPDGKRKALIEEYGYDVKFGYHVVRLLLECEQILATGTIDLQRDREILKSIRRGEWSLDKLKGWFDDKEKQLEELYNKSTIPWGPDEDKIKELLLEVLSNYYGNLDSCIVIENRAEQAIAEVIRTLNKFGYK